MGIKFSALQCKEVICINDGKRLGFITDIDMDPGDGSIRAIIVPGPGRLLGLMGQKEDYFIPWCCIRRIGPDIVLVDIRPDECRVPRTGFSAKSVF